MNVNILPAYIPMHYMCAWGPWREEEGFASSGTGNMDGYKPPCGFWDLNQGPLQEQ